MNSTVEKVSSNKVKIRLEADAAAFEKGMQAAYKKMVGRINIPGFRKGKAPRKVIEVQYGESIFYEEAIEAIFPDMYDAAIEEHKIDPVDRPSIDVEQIGEGKPLILTAEVFVRPDVTLGQYMGVEIHSHDHPVTDEMVDEDIERAQERVARFEDITDRPVKDGDEVDLDYAGTVDGVPFEGGTAEGQKLTIGSGRFIPGFEEQMIGMEIGEERDLSVTFPEEYHSEELSGKEAVFHVKVNAIREKQVPALDDEFAKDVSEFDTLDEYKADLRKKLEESAAEHAKSAQENMAVDAAAKNAEVDVPDPMVERQIDSLLRDMQMRMMYNGLRMEDYLQYTGMTMEALRDQYREQALSNVKSRLVLDAIKEKEGIEADEEAVEAEIVRYAEQSKRSPEEFKNDLTPDDWESIRDSVAIQKVVDLLRENAVIVAEGDHDHNHDHEDHDHEDYE